MTKTRLLEFLNALLTTDQAIANDKSLDAGYRGAAMERFRTLQSVLVAVEALTEADPGPVPNV